MSANERAREAYLNDQPLGVLQGIESHIDQALEAFVFNVYEGLINDYSSAILNLAVMYVIFYVLAIYRGLIQATTEEMFNAVIRLIIVTSVLLNFGDFLRFIHDALTVWPDQLIATIISAGSNDPTLSSAASAKYRMDLYFDQGWKIGMQIMEMGGFSTVIYAVAVLIAVFLMGAIPFGIFLVAKVAIAVLLGLGPLFIVMLYFKKTQGFFEGWVRNLASMVFLKIIVFAAMMLYLFIAKFPMEDLVKKAADDDGLIFSDFAGLLIMAYVMWRFYKHVSSIASSIGSGFVLQISPTVSKAYEMGAAGMAKSAYSAVAGGISRLRSKA